MAPLFGNNPMKKVEVAEQIERRIEEEVVEEVLERVVERIAKDAEVVESIKSYENKVTTTTIWTQGTRIKQKWKMTEGLVVALIVVVDMLLLLSLDFNSKKIQAPEDPATEEILESMSFWVSYVFQDG